jgi:hypothetical protein
LSDNKPLSFTQLKWPGPEICGPPLAWGRDADGVGTAGADGTACDGVQGFVEADLDRGEEIMAAADGEAVARDCRIGARKERDDFGRGHRCLCCEAGEFRWDRNGMNCSASGGEKGAGVEAGAGTMRAPLMLEESRVGVDVFKG